MTIGDIRHDVANAGLVLNQTRKNIQKGRTVTEQDAERLAYALKEVSDAIETLIREFLS